MRGNFCSIIRKAVTTMPLLNFILICFLHHVYFSCRKFQRPSLGPKPPWYKDAQTPIDSQNCALLNDFFFFLNVDGAMHFIYSHKYNTNSAEDSSDMN